MNVISIKHSLVLIRCGVHHGHVVAVIRRVQSVLVAVQNHFLQTCPVGNCILAVSQFVRIQLFQSEVEAQFTHTGYIGTEFHACLLVPASHVCRHRFGREDL